MIGLDEAAAEQEQDDDPECNETRQPEELHAADQSDRACRPYRRRRARAFDDVALAKQYAGAKETDATHNAADYLCGINRQIGIGGRERQLHSEEPEPARTERDDHEGSEVDGFLVHETLNAD